MMRWRTSERSLQRELGITLFAGVLITAVLVPLITFGVIRMQLEEAFRNQAIMASTAVAKEALYPVIGGSRVIAQLVVNNMMQWSGVQYAEIVDDIGHISMAEAGSAPLGFQRKQLEKIPTTARVVAETASYWRIVVPLRTTPSPTPSTFGERDESAPSDVVGYVDIVFSKDTLQKLVALLGVACVASSPGVAALILWGGAIRLKKLTVPLHRAAALMAEGVTTGRSVRVREEGFAELRTVAHIFNQLMKKLEEYQNELETKVARRTAELQQATEAALQAERYKSSLLAASSHEMKMPIHIIELSVRRSLHELEFMGYEANEVREAQRTILRASGDLLSRILKLLAAARTDTTQPEIVKSEFTIAQFVQDVRERIAPVAASQGNQFCTEEIGNPLASCDREKAFEIVSELLMNACKFTHGGTVKLTIECDNRHLLIIVNDNGCGIPEAEQENIWKEFHQVSGVASPTYPGQGLGLSMVKNLVGLLRGSIALESKVGVGTTVRIRLPVET
jgi:signal transduction histidine kinase